MTTEKMTIHKALCELKTLDARITKSIGETEYVFANKHSNDKVNGMTVAAYCDEIKSGYQRVTDSSSAVTPLSVRLCFPML